MRRSLFNLAATASAFALGLTLIACYITPEIDPLRQFIRLPGRCYLSLTGRDGKQSITLFNDTRIGPYPGTFGIASSRSSLPHPQITGFADIPGVYYQRIQYRDGMVIWRFLLSLWYPLIATAILPLVWVVRATRKHNRDLSTCACGYDLRATPERCPECGASRATA